MPRVPGSAAGKLGAGSVSRAGAGLRGYNARLQRKLECMPAMLQPARAACWVGAYKHSGTLLIPPCPADPPHLPAAVQAVPSGEW